MRKNISFRGVLLCSLIALTGSAFAQTETQPNAKPAQYFFVLLNNPANAPQISKEVDETLTSDCRTLDG
jgi:hypothetical protein